jgi:hypothetical protein
MAVSETPDTAVVEADADPGRCQVNQAQVRHEGTRQETAPMKTAYVISPGLQLPANFQWRGAPIILSQGGLWDAMKTLPSGLVFRVRTEQNVGDALNGVDRIESAVGMLDSTSRWRACLALIRIALSGLRVPDTAEACWNVFNMMMNKHPASVLMTERQTLAAQLRIATDKLPPDDPRSSYEAQCAGMCMRLAFADNDIEVAHIVPYSSIYMVNGQEHPEDREATVEVISSGVFLAESFARMSEKAPEWLFSPLPKTPGSPAKPAAGPAEGQDELDDEDEG